MKYTIDKQEKYCLLKLHEEKLDSNVAPNLKSELITIHAEGAKNIILDLSGVKYTDSSGLSALLVGNRVIQENGGIFVLSGLSDHTMKLIKISQLDSVLNILPTVEEAIDAVFMNELENDLKQGEDEN
ncbi:STAS domain-containing protein [Fulvivirga sp. 29W222]|uniref:Anti-sigma factor antagonist n=1 Tax=Fulvivirga marina TaxID=2494733 RepID=A0A937G686_9BACT|nr:STAS domain-containing protein [Fulvivirga marina]MBL6449186.1 STAS domain-containing protein [Fulvivirga marina]